MARNRRLGFRCWLLIALIACGCGTAQQLETSPPSASGSSTVPIAVDTSARNPLSHVRVEPTGEPKCWRAIDPDAQSVLGSYCGPEAAFSPEASPVVQISANDVGGSGFEVVVLIPRGSTIQVDGKAHPSTDIPSADQAYSVIDIDMAPPYATLPNTMVVVTSGQSQASCEIRPPVVELLCNTAIPGVRSPYER
jgi:hypothetical protein